MAAIISALTIYLCTAAAVRASTCEDVYPQLTGGITARSQSECTEAGLCWSGEEKEGFCFFPKIFGYEAKVTSNSQNKILADLTLLEPSGALGPDFSNLSLDIRQETKTRTHLRITNKDPNPRWEVPYDLILRESDILYNESDASTEIFIVNESPLELGVRRSGRGGDRSKNDVLFFMSKMLVFQDQYIEVVLSRPKGVLQSYGFGESSRLQQALEATDSAYYVLWNTDVGASGFNQSLYGSHPFYLQVFEDGTVSGILLMSSNAMRVQLANSEDKGDSLAYQIAGGMIDFYIFSGPTASDVIAQLTEVIGRPAIMPYWALGFHNCRWGYPDLAYVKEVVANYSKAGIPLETQWTDIDYMQNYLDFTTDSIKFPADEMSAWIESLHSSGQHYVPIVDPGIYAVPNDPSKGESEYLPQVEGLKQKVFVTDLYGKDAYIGSVWPGPTYFPDWFASNATSYWTEQLDRFRRSGTGGLGIKFDGIWIDMNEVSNFCNQNGAGQVCTLSCECTVVEPDNKYDFPPWVPEVPQGSLGGKTMPMSATHAGGQLEYNAHNLYGLMESVATHSAVKEITGKRPFVLSRSTFLSSGKHAAHWTGDNAATWNDLKVSIITMNNMALFGLPMTGADICGFNGDTTEELCGRWAQVGAFSPFMRNHNTIGALPQEFYRWDSVADISKRMIEMRYTLLPYLYTLLFKAHDSGSTVHNPLWMHFSQDPNTLSPDCDGQFMWSDGLLFTPVLTQGATEVAGYFPKGIWYPLMGSSQSTSIINSAVAGQWVTLSTPLETTNIHLRGGTVLPTQKPAMTLAEARLNPFSLVVALDSSSQASGFLFLDDGEQPELRDYSLVNFEVEYDATRGVHVLLSLPSASGFGDVSRKTTLTSITVLDASRQNKVDSSRLRILSINPVEPGVTAEIPASMDVWNGLSWVSFPINGIVQSDMSIVFSMSQNTLLSINLATDRFRLAWK